LDTWSRKKSLGIFFLILYSTINPYPSPAQRLLGVLGRTLPTPKASQSGGLGEALAGFWQYLLNPLPDKAGGEGGIKIFSILN